MRRRARGLGSNDINATHTPHRRNVISMSDFPSLLDSKRAELDQINENRIIMLETMLREKETKYHTLNNAYSTLKTDFVYNLKLIDDRDTELERFDRAFLQVGLLCN
jgi:hypothetical protein